MPRQAQTLCNSQEEREEKLGMVEFYNDRLTEREKRRDFLRARGLLSVKRMQVGCCAPPPECICMSKEGSVQASQTVIE